jgi:hypothetical protein
MSYVNTLVAMNRFNRNKANSITSKSYNRERNVHEIHFERVIGDAMVFDAIVRCILLTGKN